MLLTILQSVVKLQRSDETSANQAASKELCRQVDCDASCLGHFAEDIIKLKTGSSEALAKAFSASAVL